MIKFIKKIPKEKALEVKVDKKDFNLKDGDIVIAAITSCTNTSNPSVLIGAGLLAKMLLKKDLRSSHGLKLL